MRYTIQPQDGLYPWAVIDTRDGQIFGEFPSRREADNCVDTTTRMVSVEDQ